MPHRMCCFSPHPVKLRSLQSSVDLQHQNARDGLVPALIESLALGRKNLRYPYRKEFIQILYEV